MGIVAGIYVVGAISGIYELSLVDRFLDGSAPQSEVDSYLQFADSLNALLLLATLASAIAVFAWLSRTVEIVPPLGGGTPRRSPREAIGWWFVPIAFLFVPYQIVRDVYQRLETPTRRGGDGSVLAWWLLFIIGGLASRAVSTSLTGATTIDVVRNLEMIAIVTNVSTCIGGLLFVRIIGEIEARASERAVSLSLRGPDAIWPTQIGASPAPAPVATPVSVAPLAAPALGAEVARASAPAAARLNAYDAQPGAAQGSTEPQRQASPPQPTTPPPAPPSLAVPVPPKASGTSGGPNPLIIGAVIVAVATGGDAAG